MKSIQIKFLPLLALAFGVLFFTSCSKDDDNMDDTVTEEVDDNVLSFTLIQDGVETIDISTSLDANTDCLFGRVNDSYASVFDDDWNVIGEDTLQTYLIGNGSEFQLLWSFPGSSPVSHTFVDEPDTGISFILLNPCDETAGSPVYSLQNYTVVLDEVGEAGDVMSGTFEGELAVDGGDFVEMSGSFSVPRID